ncbi:MAG TPA: hypothetical protein VFE05_07155 [Longimicrobiaceae bacterium]|jgi:hypothetical protein|nr:hypothetical protein [Longimicrobiaceae bacterium]
MLLFALASGLLLAVAALLVGALRAHEDEHIVVLSWEDRGFVLLERVSEGCYEIRPPVLLPLVVARYAIIRAKAAAGSRHWRLTMAPRHRPALAHLPKGR